MLSVSRDVGIDLGTANSVVFVRHRGIVLREPSVVAIDNDTRRVLAVGEQARRMLGRTPGNIVAVRPLRDGVIADYDVTEMLLRHFLQQVLGRRVLFRPRVVVCVPAGVTTVERRAVLDATLQAGARRAFLLEEPVAAALGAGLDISEPRGHMVVDIGGGTTDIAVLSLGGVVVSHSLKAGGDRFDQAIVRFVRQEFNLMIGERTAEEVKMNIGTAIPGRRTDTWDIRGRDLMTGLPRNLSLSADQVYAAIQETVTDMTGAIRMVLEQTPPEVSSDIIDRGIVLTGGGALLRDLDVHLSETTKVPVHVAEDPLSCVALGTGKTLESLDVWANILTGKES
ncbi:MAG: rod shape-determining protein [Thermaerobacterales bacterium]